MFELRSEDEKRSSLRNERRSREDRKEIERRQRMTDREKAIVMAYTGITMLSGEKFQIFHEYIEKILGRPVFTHELGNKLVSAEIRKKSRADFLEICKTEERPTVEQYKEKYDMAIKAIHDIKEKVWEIDIPSPTIPEYVEHHEQVKSVLKVIYNWLTKLEEVENE